jgi:hypothetical protein
MLARAKAVTRSSGPNFRPESAKEAATKRRKKHKTAIGVVLCSLCLFVAASPRQSVVVTVASHPAAVFSPHHALGAGVDGHRHGEVSLSPSNVREMLSAGFKPLTYRLRTELAMEAWHWNPKGSWSDPRHQQGYWTSDSKPSTPIQVSYGYRLPRRGSTVDQANNDGYSRIDDGSRQTFWKSNPYLDQHFTGEPNETHPQWVIVDLATEKPVDTIRINWGDPYATVYQVEYGIGEDAGPDAGYVREDGGRIWRRFLNGSIRNSKGGDSLLRLSDAPVETRYVRVLMFSASGTRGNAAHRDVRDRLGYAIREIYIGTTNAQGRFQDLINHAAEHDKQTVIAVSSTDPWHRRQDRDEDIEQPGFDLIFRSGLSNGMPVLVPIPLLYDTPENGRAEIAYLRTRGYPVERAEMGEEPDGQYTSPEDYGALYLEWAKQLDPGLKLGGPSFATLDSIQAERPAQPVTRFWMSRFLKYLGEHNRLDAFSFFSFEWYPFDEICEPTPPQLAGAPAMLETALSELEKGGLSRTIPRLITEYGYSAFAGQPEVDIEGALLNSELVAQFLTLGGEQTFFYGYEPGELIQEVPCTWGVLALFLREKSGRAGARLATYHAARMLTEQWAQPVDRPHELYRVSSEIPLLTAFAVHRPDGAWALLLINKDPENSRDVAIQFQDAAADRRRPWSGPAELYQFSRAQYAWQPNGEDGRPTKSEPPEHRTVEGGQVRLPPYSLSVVRGRGIMN